MKISTKVRYGMRAMIELARRNNEAPVMLGIIAKNQDLSEKYLEQLFTMLRNAGLVKSERGNKGGYRLARKPEEISALEIFEALNGPLELVECAMNRKSCIRSEICNTVSLWTELNQNIRGILASRDLSQMAGNGTAFPSYDI